MRKRLHQGSLPPNSFGFTGDVSVNVIISVKQSSLSGLQELLQAGFLLICTVGVSIKSLLCDQFGLNPQFVDNRISTIFFDGKPVDDIDATTVMDGATIALSGAMPGLVGATLRRKSPLASFRQTISSSSTPLKGSVAKGVVRIKVFNILMDELGPLFLRRGVFLRADTLRFLLEKQPAEFWEECVRIPVNDTPEYPPAFREKILAALKIEDAWVRLIVHGVY
jgi:hypothetical protein